MPARRAIRTAELLAVGSELTAGETQDTNGGELARSLAGSGVAVRRIVALPDDLALVAATFREAMDAVDLVVATGGLGPTPDDLTREAIAAAIGEQPAVDPQLEGRLRDLFAQRGTPLPLVNLKQAWRIPSATSIPNLNGTAPGWWVDRPDGRVTVLLPGPPREMRPMWSDWVLPRLGERGLGDGRLVRTLRTYGIGESHVAELLGDAVLRAGNPVVATYARSDWLDVRVSAVAGTSPDGIATRTAGEVLEEAIDRVRATLAGYVWAEGETSWSELVGAAAGLAGTRFATVEAGTRGALATMLADIRQLVSARILGPETEAAVLAARVEDLATEAATAGGADAGVALAAWEAGTETRLRAAVAAAGRETRALELRLFQRGAHGRLRAAVATAAFMIECFRSFGSDEAP